VRFGRDETGYFVQIPLPNASGDDLDVVVVDEELIVTAGACRRFLRLPRRMAGCRVLNAKLEAQRLTVHFSLADSQGEDR
jgi:hypothetical protein